LLTPWAVAALRGSEWSGVVQFASLRCFALVGYHCWVECLDMLVALHRTFIPPFIPFLSLGNLVFSKTLLVCVCTAGKEAASPVGTRTEKQKHSKIDQIDGTGDKGRPRKETAKSSDYGRKNFLFSALFHTNLAAFENLYSFNPILDNNASWGVRSLALYRLSSLFFSVFFIVCLPSLFHLS
jgi:hypothetical protein